MANCWLGDRGGWSTGLSASSRLARACPHDSGISIVSILPCSIRQSKSQGQHRFKEYAKRCKVMLQMSIDMGRGKKRKKDGAIFASI